MFGENLFAGFGVVSAYTREQAIKDGVLVDVSHCARDTGFNVDTVVTRPVWDRCVKGPEGPRLESGGQEEEGRLRDVLWMVSVAVQWPDPDSSGYQQEHELWLHIGPGDAGEPVLTIMFPEDW